MSSRPVLQQGSFGADVGTVQSCLGCDADLDFGAQTDTAVCEFQAAKRLEVDGVVGGDTWAALESEYELPAYPAPPIALTQEQINAICDIAATSAIACYAWEDRGVAPPGYTNGIAVAFAIGCVRLDQGDPIAAEMARANTGDDAIDALSWYDSDFAALGMANNVGGVDTLRHLYVLMMGLGMRESSGAYCEGRDMSADNVSADTAEAGLFQMSWNASSCSTSMQNLFDCYAAADRSEGYQDVFQDGVSCSSSDWENYGSGDGAQYQEMAKSLPLFACETAAIGLRSLRQHWGPINRKEVELRGEADAMLAAVADYVAEHVITPPDPRPPVDRPTTTITITVCGARPEDVRVTVT
jgi:hypothetical protein